MKGVFFYLEHDSPRDFRKGNHTGNCIAVSTERETTYWTQEHHNDGRTRYVLMHEAIVPLFSDANSAVCSGAVRDDDLGYSRYGRYKRISEAEARAIHPALFAYLET